MAAVLLAAGIAACTNTTGDGQTPAAPTSSTARAGDTEQFTFDESASLPAAATVFDGIWIVRAESDTSSGPNALCQIGTATFPSVALSRENYRDGAFTVRFKPISGKEDQAAGIVFRVVDRNNYYILRANALEGNVNFYTYLDGKLAVIGEAATTVGAGIWHELRVEVAGPVMIGYLDGIQVSTVTDSTLRSGRVGLWAKADSQTCFDDLTVNAR